MNKIRKIITGIMFITTMLILGQTMVFAENQEGGNWTTHGIVDDWYCYQREDGTYVQKGWIKIEDQWYYIDPVFHSSYFTGQIRYINHKNYLFKKEGHYPLATKEFVLAVGSSNQWYYADKNGEMVKSQWVYQGKNTYYMDEKGFMARSRWVQDGTNFYYVLSNGKMARERWIEQSGVYYYIKANGKMAKNEWIQGQKVNERYYVRESGAMVKNMGFLEIDEKYYSFQTGGKIRTGWYLHSDGRYYYFNKSGQNPGSMMTGWLLENNKWYYLIPYDSKGKVSGAMVANTTLKIDGKNYTFDANGVWKK